MIAWNLKAHLVLLWPYRKWTSQGYRQWHTRYSIPRDAMLARYMLSLCVCASVRLSVRLSEADTVPKRLNTGSRRTRRNSNGVTPYGAPNRGGVGSNWWFSTNISLYLKNGARYYGTPMGTSMRSIECGAISSHLACPLNIPSTPFSLFCIALCIFVVGRDREETSNLVDRLIVASASPRMEKLSLKGAWSNHVNHLHFGGHQPYLRNGWS